MDKLKYIKLENADGSYSQSIPLAVDSGNVDVNGNTLTSVLNGKASKAEVQSVASGSPAGVYETVAALTTADPDHNKIYVVTADGYWYYYNGSTWTAGGIYQASVDNDMIKILQENDYDMAKHIVKLNSYSELIQKNLIKPYDYTEKNGLFAKSKGISRITVSGSVATENTIIKYGESFILEGGATYTYACFDLEEDPTVNNCVSPYFCLTGTTTAYRIDGDIVQLRCTKQDSQLFKTFTVPQTVTVDPTIYVGANLVARKGTFRIFLVKGEYSQEDFIDDTILSEHLEGRVFKGTINPTTSIPTHHVPVFYLGKGPGPYSNFGSSAVFPDCSFIIFLNNVQNNTWNIYSLPLMTNDAVIRTSLTTFIPTSSEPSVPFGQRKWGLCCQEGTYTNFKDYSGNSLTLEAGEMAIFSMNYDVNTDHKWWHKDIINNATTKTYVDTTLANALEPITSDIESYIYTWLTEHPEATTTVQDGAITIAKLDSNLADKANKFRADNGSSTTWEDNNNDLNTIIGYNNMPNGIGSRNTIIGIDNLQANNAEHSANKEVAIGYHALFRDWDGHHNISIGNESMDNLSHGGYNTAVGSNTLRVQRVSNYGGTDVEGETCNYNTAYGGDAMYYTYGDNNTALGYAALKGHAYGATGSGNVAIGAHAGRHNSDENNHLFIDNQDRSNRTNEVNKSLIYGTFANDIANQFIKINGMFACNGVTPQAPLTASADATDLASALILLNQIKDALIKAGIMK